MGETPAEDQAARTLAKVVSFTIQPISIGMAVSIIVPMTVHRDLSIAFLPILIGCIFLGLFPLVPILLAVAHGRTDIMVYQQERRGPIFMSAIGGYGIGLVIFLLLGAREMAGIAGGFVIITGLLLLINQRTKISVHMASVGGGSTFLVYFLFYYHRIGPGVAVVALVVCTVLVTLVGWARLQLKAHTRSQVIMGTIVSVLVTLALCIVFWPL